MSKFQSKSILLEAKDAVAAASYSPKKLTLLHTGIAAGASLLVSLLTYLLSTGIGETGGLTGISSRAMLETAQSLLQIAISVLTPFWSLGFIACALGFARRQAPTPRTLLQGFRHWGPILRMLLLEILIYFAVLFIGIQIGSFLYMMTPFASQLNDLAAKITAAGTLDAELMSQFLQEMDYDTLMSLFWGMAPFLFLPALVVSIWLAYRLRLAEYILMDMPEKGALFALTMSFRLMKKNCVHLLKLDLRFWWFYALQILVQVLCYGDLLLPLLGMEIGMNGILASFLFYALALLCQVGLYVWKKPQVFTGYALFYDRLIPREEA